MTLATRNDIDSAPNAIADTAFIQASPVWPLDIVLHEASGQLAVLWNDGRRSSFAAAALRAACRCAACESARRGGHPPLPAAGLALAALHPIGEFGLQLCFSDGHDRGIYPWAFLYELGAPQRMETPA